MSYIKQFRWIMWTIFSVLIVLFSLPCLLIFAIMESDRPQSDELDWDMIPVSGIRVLVVDGDSACLAVVSKILRTLGYEAGPKQILEHMNAPGLKNEILSSFLQRYRLLLKQHKEAIKDPTDLHLGSGLLSQTNNLRRICIYFSENRGVNHKPDSSSNGQKDLDSSTSMHRPGPSHSPSREIPTGQELISSQNQSILPCNPEGVVVPPKPAVGESLINGNNGKEISGSSKAENATGEDIFKSDTFFSYLDYTDEENEMLYSTLLPVYPLPLEGEEELQILEDEGGDIDDLMDFPKGAEFNDDDLNLWLSTL